jgi:hypothetical protein
MSATIISRDKGSITLQVTIEFSNSMLSSEEAILESLNEAGTLATNDALKQFDTDGSPIENRSEKWTSKGELSKTYQTPYGETQIARHVSQSSNGGETYCPLENDARIVVTSTPRFAKMVSNKHAKMASPQVEDDLIENHGRNVARSYSEKLESSITFFENHCHQMDYAQSVKNNLPIGSGVTEAACKTIVKQRLCQSGISLQEIGAAAVLSLRTLVLTKGRP